MTTKIIVLCFALISQGFCWEALPSIPTGRRSQFLVLHENGGYKYGYDTGDGSAAKQSGDASNQVEGHYFYKDAAGQNIDLKYTSGVQGFVPENLDQVLAKAAAAAPSRPLTPVVPVAFPAVSQYSSNFNRDSSSHDDQSGTGDASYSFNIKTDTYQRQESSDARGNVQGRYSYQNNEGTHDLSYIAGENTGFVATSGSLAKANGLTGQHGSSSLTAGARYGVTPVHATGYTYGAPTGVNQQTDGSYSFAYSTGDSSRQESADAGNNVQGRYSYQNSQGTHDLSYVAGSATGFQVTGGSLASPNGLTGSQQHQTYSASVHSVPAVPAVPTHPVTSSRSGESGTVSQSTDGSYSFSYNTGDSSRQESADSNNNVQGRYSYSNNAGSHDLSYVAGAATGFQVTGGSLSSPNGLTGKSVSSVPAVPTSYSYPSVPSVGNSLDSSSHDDQSNTGDASYSFTIDTDEYKRKETSDASGNVQGSYSYKNAAGTHDLSFVAGSQTGFLPTGGSLANPETAVKSAVSTYPASTYPVATTGVVLARSGSESHDDQSNTGDASYSFTIDTDEYKRQETSDAAGNVRGSYSYKNEAGVNDLSYVAGSATGFQPTGGNLADPNQITAKIAALPQTKSFVVPQTRFASVTTNSVDSSSHDDQANTGDASYSFTIDTDEYKRHESSDASGNVQGSYSYKNGAGDHHLSFVAGSATGFQPTGGSLSVAPGLNEAQLRSGVSHTSHVVPTHSAVHSVPSLPVVGVARTVPSNAYLPATKTSVKLGNVVVHSYLPPSNEKQKYGYVLDSQ